MRVQKIVARQIDIPFKMEFRHSLASRKGAEAVLVEVVTDRGVSGWGEGTPRSYVTGETPQTVFEWLERTSASFLGLEIEDGADVWRWLRSVETAHGLQTQDAPSGRCALELALLDVWGKSMGACVCPSAAIGQPTNYSGIVSADDPRAVAAILEQMKLLDLRQVKLKVGNDMEADAENLRLIRSIMGPGVEVRIDANAAWSLAEAIEHIARFHDQGIRIVEQPLPAAHREDYPLLRNEISEDIIVMIDESLCSYEDALWYIENRGASGFNLKISKHGGLLNSLRIYQTARRHGIACQLGCHVGETSILTAAGAIFSMLAKDLTAMEGAFGSHLLAYDVVAQPLQFGTRGRPAFDLSKTGGLGIDVVADRVERAAVREMVIE